jgi:hypothetical protein
MAEEVGGDQPADHADGKGRGGSATGVQHGEFDGGITLD